MSDAGQNIMTYFVIIVVIGIITAIFLASLASKEGSSDKLEDLTSVPPPIAKSLNDLSVHPSERVKIANTVSQWVKQEVETKTEQIKKEITHRFEDIIVQNETAL